MMDRARSVVNVFILYFYFKTSAINNARKAPATARGTPLSLIAPTRDFAPFRPLPGNCVRHLCTWTSYETSLHITVNRLADCQSPPPDGREAPTRRGTALGRKFPSRNKTFPFVLNSIFLRNTGMLTRRIIHFPCHNFRVFKKTHNVLHVYLIPYFIF